MTITTQQFIGIGVGASANDGTGDDLRTAFQKVNANFGWISNTGFNAANMAVSTIEATGTISALQGIINQGATVETAYRQLKPTANIAVTANVGTNRMLLHPTGTIVSFGANVTLPNTQTDGTIFSISSNITIASLDVRPAWNGVVDVSPSGNVTNVTAGLVSRFIYIAADYRWYKIA
jgi:hypothetical protein